MCLVRWIFLLLAGTVIATSAEQTRAETGSGLGNRSGLGHRSSLGYLLESPLTYRPLGEPRWSRSGRSAYDLSNSLDLRWSQRGRTGDRSGLSYPRYYRFGERVPGFYNDREHRFWSNSYGGPWYYPGSPANTRSGWLEWKPLDW